MRLPLTLLILVALASCGTQAPPVQNAQSAAEAGAEAPSPAPKLDRSRSGQAAPDGQLDDPDGDAATLASFEGKPLLLNLWATWCPPCVHEMPALDRLAAAQGDKLQVVALSEDGDDRAKVDAFFDKHKLKALEPYLDPKMALMSALKVDTLPTTILYDAEGREVWRIVGEEDWQSPRAAALLGEAVRRRRS
jgi:thiol-disulfide isomerase/thioredoxin